MTPPIVNKIPILNKWRTPLDFDRKWRGKRVLGDNKTWRGLVSATLVGGITALIISKLNSDTIINFPPFIVGCSLGFGALAGDAFESFIKRQRGMKSGQLWFPFDQIDYILSGLLIAALLVELSIWTMLTILIVYFSLHLMATYFGYLLKIRDRPI